MQDKEMIKELAKNIANIHRRFLEDECGEILDDYIAEKLVEQGYCRIREDSVVLTREEQERILNATEKHIKQLKKELSQAHKETAERDFNTVIEALETKKASIMTHYGVAESVGVDVAIRTVKELAKTTLV